MTRATRILTAVAATALAAVALAAPAGAKGQCGDPATRPWCNTSLSPEERAGLLLSVLSQDEKISLLGGDSVTGVLGGDHAHTGVGTGVPRVGLPTINYSDGPLGPRQGKVTAMPAPIGLAATFDPNMAFLHGETIGNEARLKGNDVVYAPTVNIMRTPLGGRTFEAYGEDPWLVSRLTVKWIEGAQGAGVIANVKHFAANNQEGYDPTGITNRPGLKLPFGAGVIGARMVVNAVVAERTLREIYLPQFEAAVKEAHVGTVMCSYNRLNGQYACENEHLLQDILRREWGFNGFVLADYLAAHNVIASFNNGLDFEPFPPLAYQPLEVAAIMATTLGSTDTLDQHVLAQLRTFFRFGVFDRDAYVDDPSKIDQPKHAENARRIEESAITLLRNDGTLPIDAKAVKSIAVIGTYATKFITGAGSGNVVPFSYKTPLQAILERVGPGVKVVYNDGSNPADAAAVAKGADVALVFAGDFYAEGADRSCLTLECPPQGDQDGMISAVAAANRKTVTVLMNGGPTLTPWRSQLAGLLEAWYPGLSGGSAITRVLFGDVDPGGRLPATFPESESQEPVSGDQEKYPGLLDVKYKEGVFVGYRWFDEHKLKPAFPFGFGLSYTKFAYSKLKLTRGKRGYDARATITVRNTGKRSGWVVPQLYVALPQPRPGVQQPPWQLKGAAKYLVAPGKSRRIAFNLNRRAFSYWNTPAGTWSVAAGCYGIGVGTSSRDLLLHGSIARRGAKGCGRGALVIGAKK